MARFTIRKEGFIQGTYSGANEQEALDAHAKEAGHASFEAQCAATKASDGSQLSRDHFKVQKVED